MTPASPRLLLVGFGPVARAFATLLAERRQALARRGVAPVITGIASSHGTWLATAGALERDPDAAARVAAQVEDGARLEDIDGTRPGVDGMAAIDLRVADVLLEATSSDLDTGEPAADHIRSALEHGMDVVAASKGGLVAHGPELRTAAARAGRRIRYGAATGAALPALDMLEFGLAGAEVERIEGILNGTSNAILTAMRLGGTDFDEALRDAQARGIAEADPRRDVDGWDTAAKLVLLAGAAWGDAPALRDVEREGISGIAPRDIAAATAAGGMLRLVGAAWREAGTVRIRVAPQALPASHPLSGVDGAEKAVLYETSTLGRITVMGGASSPRGAAAAMLRDVLHLRLARGADA